MLVQESSQTTIPAYLLRVGNEFDAYHQARRKRCRLIKHPLIEGDRVRLTIVPVTQPYASKRVTVVYSLQTEFEVYSEPYQRQSGFGPSLDTYIKTILEVISPDSGLLTVQQILDRCKNYKPNVAYRKARVAEACNELVRRGVLLRSESGAGNVTAFRLPLPKDLGFPVVELAGKRSERIGWIVAWKGENPIVRWLEPGYFCSLSHENLLEPLTDRFKRQQIEIAKRKLEEGLQPPILIPESLLLRLHHSRLNSPARVIYNNDPALIDIAVVLGVKTDNRPSLGYSLRNQVFEYLNLYYPNWRKGGFQ